MNPSVLLLACSLFYLTVVVIMYFKNKRISLIENNIYSVMIIVSIIGIVIDFIGIYAHLNLPNTSFIRWIIVKLYFVYLLTYMLLFTMYIVISAIDNKSSNYNLKIKKIALISGFIYFISVIINFILPFEYYNDGSVVYVYGSNSMFLYIFTGICLIFSIIYIVINFNKLKKIKYIPMLIFIIIGAPIAIVQMLNPELLLVTSLLSFVTVIMYHTIENPDMKMIAELNEAKLQAEKANNAKSEFLSNMSHEIRTPLNAIVGFSQALEEEDISGEAKEEVRDIVRASQSLLEIVNGILDISKIEANKIEIVNGEYDIYEILDDLVALTKARMGEKPLDFRIDFDPTIPHILYGDKTRIKQVILNLLTNSVKYTKEGYVEFKVSSVRKDDICRLIVSVEDSGIGIKKENLDKLFSKFERFDLDKNITIEGTGLGLAITKKLVELMHGKIVVQSIYGKGSRFTIAVDQKVVNKEKLEETDKVTDEIINLTGKKILLVDDNNLNLKVASKLLEKYNASITTLTSGNDCLEKIKTNEHFDLILLDDMMPGMSGIETIKKLREMDNYNIPTIALTANAIEGVRQKYIDAGFDDYLSKPIEKRELNRVITKFLK